MSELRPRSNRSTTSAGIARHGRLKKSSPWPTILKFLGAALVVVLVSGASVGALVFSQIKAVLVTLVWSTVATAILAFIIKAVIGLRPTPEVERQGLDVSEHGEEGYINT